MSVISTFYTSTSCFMLLTDWDGHLVKTAVRAVGIDDGRHTLFTTRRQCVCVIRWVLGPHGFSFLC